MIPSLVFIEVTKIFCIVTAFKFISSLENCIYRSVSHVWRNSILNGPLCLAYFRLSDCKDDAWSVRHAKIQSRWKKGAVSFLQSVLPFYFHFCAFCIFADPTISEPGTGYYIHRSHFRRQSCDPFGQRQAESSGWREGRKVRAKHGVLPAFHAHLQRSETMTITIDYNKKTFCACMLSWSQKELQLLLIRGADDKERSSGEQNE